MYPAVTAVLPATTTSGVRKLFQLNRVDTIAGLMHDAVLVPEGRLDFEWVKLLVRAVDLRQGWNLGDESRFGAYVGVIPTHDAAVEATVAALARLHPRVTVIVDGDATGTANAQALAGAAVPPVIILRWPDDWTIENVIGWILEADAAGALSALATMVTPVPATIAELVARLKSDDRAAHGMKQDQLAYEAVADVIGSVDACCRRARDLLNAMTDSLLGNDVARFTAEPDGSALVKVFRP